jgi:hypothetical protein
MSIGASFTVVTHISQISGIIFSRYSIICVLTAGIVAVLLTWREISKNAFQVVTMQWGLTLVLLLCGIWGGILSLICHRPDLDDSHYIPNVVYYLEHPSAPMGFDIHYLESEGKPLISYFLQTSLPFEYSQGVAAYISRIPFLTVYYMLAPALFGFLIPLVWFYVISRFSFPPWTAIIGALFVCLFLILMGEKHDSYGNLAFNRIFQGKIVLYNIGVPVFTAFTLDFFQSPSVRRWVYLLVTSVAVIGLSSSATFMIPLLSIVLLIACCLRYIAGVKNRLRYGFWYLIALIYPALYAVSIMLFSPKIDPDRIVNAEPVTFLGHAKIIFGPAMLVFWVVGSILALLLIRKNDRRFLLTWIIMAIVCYLNPVVSPILMKYVTTTVAYWRLFFIYPFPLVIGLCGAGFALLLEKSKPKWRHLILTGVISLLILAHLPSNSPSIFRLKPDVYVTTIGMPKYKMWTLAEGREVLLLKPPSGVMLSMPAVAYSLPSLSSQYKQMFVRLESLLLLNDAHHRMRASQFLGGETKEENLNSLKWIIDHYPQIRSIVASRKAAEAEGSFLFGLMKESGFTEIKLDERLVVFARPRD